MSAAPGRCVLTPHSSVTTASQLHLQSSSLVDLFLGRNCIISYYLSDCTAQGNVLDCIFKIWHLLVMQSVTSMWRVLSITHAK